MRAWTLFALSVLVLKAEGSQELRTVPSVDLQRYAGRWFEIARLPNRFQEDCAGNVTATYAPETDGKLSVVNACRKADDSVMSAKGEARRVGAAKLKVRFAPAWLSWLPMVWGDYWVMDLADDYSWAVIGEPSREYFWILSRSPEMEGAVFEDIVQRAEEQGYDLGKLVRTRQDDR